MQRTWSQGRLALALSIASTGLIALGGCQRTDAPAPAAAEPPPPPSAMAAPAYTPPTADQLYQLVAPIALFPDKLLAQTLAASVYPDQVVTAQEWLRSNSGLSAADRAQATVSQSWDPSIKALTAFPDVVAQLAGNLDWTRALGDAYAHDPNDVLNAVQIMRQRAQASGHLRSTPQQQVQVARHVVVTPIPDEGRIPPPSQVITIEPAQPDVVYVPRYDPGVVYGAPVDVYREYRYRPVRWYDEGDVVTTGLVASAYWWAAHSSTITVGSAGPSRRLSGTAGAGTAGVWIGTRRRPHRITWSTRTMSTRRVPPSSTTEIRMSIHART